MLFFFIYYLVCLIFFQHRLSRHLPVLVKKNETKRCRTRKEGRVVGLVLGRVFARAGGWCWAGCLQGQGAAGSGGQDDTREKGIALY